MKRKVRIIVAIICLLSIVLIVASLRIKKTEDGIQIGNSIIYPYSYTICENHIALNKYTGKKTVVEVPKKIWGKDVTVIGEECFAENNRIQKVYLTENITEIELYGFFRCEALEEVINGNQIRNLGPACFSDCIKLSYVELGSDVRRIEKYAFSKCTEIKTLEEQPNLEYIGELAFWESGLTEWFFSKETEIGDSAFEETEWINKQEGDFIIYGDGNLIKYNGKEKIVIIPETVKSIRGGCFENTEVDKIYVSKTVTELGDGAFYACRNTDIYIPDTVKVMPDTYFLINSDNNTKIVTTQDSVAHQYAIKYEAPFEIVEEIAYPEE